MIPVLILTLQLFSRLVASQGSGTDHFIHTRFKLFPGPAKGVYEGPLSLLPLLADSCAEFGAEYDLNGESEPQRRYIPPVIDPQKYPGGWTVTLYQDALCQEEIQKGDFPWSEQLAKKWSPDDIDVFGYYWLTKSGTKPPVTISSSGDTEALSEFSHATNANPGPVMPGGSGGFPEAPMAGPPQPFQSGAGMVFGSPINGNGPPPFQTGGYSRDQNSINQLNENGDNIPKPQYSPNYLGEQATLETQTSPEGNFESVQGNLGNVQQNSLEASSVPVA